MQGSEDTALAADNLNEQLEQQRSLGESENCAIITDSRLDVVRLHALMTPTSDLHPCSRRARTQPSALTLACWRVALQAGCLRTRPTMHCTRCTWRRCGHAWSLQTLKTRSPQPAPGCGAWSAPSALTWPAWWGKLVSQLVCSATQLAFQSPAMRHPASWDCSLHQCAACDVQHVSGASCWDAAAAIRKL